MLVNAGARLQRPGDGVLLLLRGTARLSSIIPVHDDDTQVSGPLTCTHPRHGFPCHKGRLV